MDSPDQEIVIEYGPHHLDFISLMFQSALLGACRRIEFVTRPSEKIRIKAEAKNTAEGVLEHIESGFFGDNAEPVFCSRSQ